jgi:adenine phosphoribosyltransferase
MTDLKAFVRDVSDFPKKGIVFKDITPILKAPDVFQLVIDHFYNRYKTRKLGAVVAIESRGFIFGGALAAKLGISFIPVRKPGKLPWNTIEETYDLEYGKDKLQIHSDAFELQNKKVIILDDVLATGGTAAAAVKLVERAGGKVEEAAFLIELAFLNGRQKLSSTPVFSLINY